MGGRDRARLPGRRRARGLSLLEMLVVFLLVTFLGTLLIQGFGFFLGKYDTVRRAHREASLETLHHRWFASTVAGMIPYRQADRSFVGNASSFYGVTLQPLAARSGIPVRARWFIDPEAAPSVVTYEEESLVAGRPAIRWPVLTAEGEVLSFRYADASQRWHVAWPPRDTVDRIPSMVSLVSETGALLWLGRPGLFPEPVQHFREPI